MWVIISTGMKWRGVKHVWGRGEVYRGFWWGNLREKDHLGDPDVDGRIILRRIFRKRDVGYTDLIDLTQDIALLD